MTVLLIAAGVVVVYALLWGMCVAAKHGDEQFELMLTTAEREWMSSEDGAA